MDAQYRTPNLSPPPKHVRDRLWQIWLPVGAAGVIILAVMVYVVITAFAPGSNGSEAYRQLAREVLAR